MRKIRCKCLIIVLLTLSMLIVRTPASVFAETSTLDKINQKKEEKKQTEGKKNEA